MTHMQKNAKNAKREKTLHKSQVFYKVEKKQKNKYVFHSSPRRLAGEKKVSAIIIKQQFGFVIRTT